MTTKDTKQRELQWRVNTPQLLDEVMTNHKMAIMHKPLTIFSLILAQVGERAAQLNDPQLNALMCRLAIYEIADQYNANYNPQKVEEVFELAENQKLEIASEESKRIVKVDIDQFKLDLGENIMESDPSERFVHEKMFEVLKNDFDQKYMALSMDGITEIVDTSVNILEDYYFDQQREKQALENAPADDSIPPQVENTAVSFEVKG